MLQWLKRSLASALGDKKDIIKKLPIIKTLNNKANTELDSRRSSLLRENFQEVLKIIYNSQLFERSSHQYVIIMITAVGYDLPERTGKHVNS
mgnify:CR=1 FL=1